MVEKDPRENCPLGLLELVDKPKDWRIMASRILIELYFTAKFQRKMMKLLISLIILTLSIILGGRLF